MWRCGEFEWARARARYNDVKRPVKPKFSLAWCWILKRELRVKEKFINKFYTCFFLYRYIRAFHILSTNKKCEKKSKLIYPFDLRQPLYFFFPPFRVLSQNFNIFQNPSREREKKPLTREKRARRYSISNATCIFAKISTLQHFLYIRRKIYWRKKRKKKHKVYTKRIKEKLKRKKEGKTQCGTYIQKKERVIDPEARLYSSCWSRGREREREDSFLRQPFSLLHTASVPFLFPLYSSSSLVLLAVAGGTSQAEARYRYIPRTETKEYTCIPIYNIYIRKGRGECEGEKPLLYKDPYQREGLLSRGYVINARARLLKLR